MSGVNIFKYFSTVSRQKCDILLKMYVSFIQICVDFFAHDKNCVCKTF